MAKTQILIALALLCIANICFADGGCSTEGAAICTGQANYPSCCLDMKFNAQYCYNSAEHNCFATTGGNRLCSANEKLCGAGSDALCFNDQYYDCKSDVLCGKGEEVCGTNKQCYNPDQFSCSNDILCPKGNAACGSACYDTTLYCCFEGAVRQLSESVCQPSA